MGTLSSGGRGEVWSSQDAVRKKKRGGGLTRPMKTLRLCQGQAAEFSRVPIVLPAVPTSTARRKKFCRLFPCSALGDALLGVPFFCCCHSGDRQSESIREYLRQGDSLEMMPKFKNDAFLYGGKGMRFATVCEEKPEWKSSSIFDILVCEL